MVSILTIALWITVGITWAFAIRATLFHFLDLNHISYSTKLKRTSTWIIFALLMQLGSFFYVVQLLLFHWHQ